MQKLWQIRCGGFVWQKQASHSNFVAILASAKVLFKSHRTAGCMTIDLTHDGLGQNPMPRLQTQE